MSDTMRKKSGLYWMLGFAGAATLSSLAWHQIHVALMHCLWVF
jgi:hypothetical protein